MLVFTNVAKRPLYLLTAGLALMPLVAFAASDTGAGAVQFSLPAQNQSQPSNTKASANPWDYTGEGQAEAPAAVAAGNGQSESATAKHWTEMNYNELKAEIERTDTNYSANTRAQMQARLSTLNPTVSSAADGKPKESPTVVPVVEIQNGKGTSEANVAVPVRMVPVTTPWWKLPKNQRAAAREAQRMQNTQIQGTNAGESQKKEISPSERVYEQIRKNRGG